VSDTGHSTQATPLAALAENQTFATVHPLGGSQPEADNG